MKIAITGHSAGIGQALAKVYQEQGHEIVGLSRRNGYNIRSIPKVAAMIEPCDMFINNAQVGFAQTELLFEVWRLWQGQEKTIMVIGTMMTSMPVPHTPEMYEYLVQKNALDDACRQLMYKSFQPRIIQVKPGAVATQNNHNDKYADPDEWAQGLIRCFDAVAPNLEITEIALGPFNDGR